MELKISSVLIDDWEGRLAAERRGILPLGTLNILYSADLHGLLDFQEAIVKLRQTNFHIEPALVDKLLEKVRARKSP